MPDSSAVLLDLARCSARVLSENALYPEVYGRIAPVLSTSAFGALAAVGDTLETRFAEGRISPPDLSPSELRRLRRGDAVIRAAEPGSPALLASPFVRRDRFLGCFVAFREDRDFSPAEIRFLLAAGRLVAPALDALRRLAEAREQTRQAEGVITAIRDLAGSLDLDEVARRISSRAHDLCGHPLVLWVAEGHVARAASTAGEPPVRRGEVRPLPPAASRLLLRGGAVVPNRKAGGNGAGAPHFLVPLTFSDRLVGFLAIWPDGTRPVATDRLRALEALAPHAATAIENARMHAELLRLSLTDPLVRLPNRRQLDWFLEKEFAAAVRGRPLAVVLFDLDKFKEYNDTHGHGAGDAALVRFADILRAETRTMNIAARYGGDEFVAVLSTTDRDGALNYAERVRQQVAEVFNGSLSVSIGVAGFEPSMRSPSEILIAADRALYSAKSAGRDKIHHAASGQP